MLGPRGAILKTNGRCELGWDDLIVKKDSLSSALIQKLNSKQTLMKVLEGFIILLVALSIVRHHTFAEDEVGLSWVHAKMTTKYY